MSGLQVVTDGPQLPPPTLEEAEGLENKSPAMPMPSTPLADTLSMLGIQVIPNEVAENHKRRLESFFNPKCTRTDGCEAVLVVTSAFAMLVTALAFLINFIAMLVINSPLWEWSTLGWTSLGCVMILAFWFVVNAVFPVGYLAQARRWERERDVNRLRVPKRFRIRMAEIQAQLPDAVFSVERFPLAALDPLISAHLDHEDYYVGSWGIFKCGGRLAKLLPSPPAK